MTLKRLAVLSFCWFANSPTLLAAPSGSSSLAGRSADWPSWEQWRRVLLLDDYNTRVVMLGVATLGGAAGLVGSFTLLRKRALMGDALSHASLPGIALAFMVGTALGLDGKSIPLLLTGATLSGLVGVGVILWIRNQDQVQRRHCARHRVERFFWCRCRDSGSDPADGNGARSGVGKFHLWQNRIDAGKRCAIDYVGVGARNCWVLVAVQGTEAAVL